MISVGLVVLHIFTLSLPPANPSFTTHLLTPSHTHTFAHLHTSHNHRRSRVPGPSLEARQAASGSTLRSHMAQMQVCRQEGKAPAPAKLGALVCTCMSPCIRRCTCVTHHTYCETHTLTHPFFVCTCHTFSGPSSLPPLPPKTTGLQAAVDLIEPIKQRHPSVSYADLYQMASAVAIEVRA